MKSLRIKYVNYGIANNYGTHIEVNKKLLKYPHLLQPILEHELSHTNNMFSLKDLALDMNHIPYLNKKEFRLFIIKNPSTWIQFSPIWIRKNKIIVDWIHLVIYIIVFLLLFVNIFLITQLYNLKNLFSLF